jgi:threonine dehydrogenase-like Zn-dependent dehydrogenase
VRVDNVPDPTIEAPTDAIVRVTSTGLCGSDLHLYEVLAPFMEPGDILGRSASGPAAALGCLLGAAILAADGVDADGVMALAAACTAARARAVVVAPHLGALMGDSGVPVPAAKAFLTAQSVEFDTVVMAGGTSAQMLAAEPFVTVFVQEAYRHHKTIAGWGEGVDALATMVPLDAAGVTTATTADGAFAAGLIEQLGWHRHWSRPVIIAGTQVVRA